MDLSIDIEDYKLNVRAAAIIIHNGKILVHKNINKPHYAIIGGRVKIGESSQVAVKREVMEEIGKDIEICNYIATIENFFYLENKKYHEMLFVYSAEFVEDDDKLIEYTLNNVEGKEELYYEWIEISKLDKYELLPYAIKEILKEDKFPVHIINNEINKI